MKDYSFYQFALTVRGRPDEKGQLAEQIFDDLAFPKQESDFHTLSDYIETEASISSPMYVFDDLFEEYQEWLKF
ncbi:YozE family protein [Staphylococcus simulans]